MKPRQLAIIIIITVLFLGVRSAVLNAWLPDEKADSNATELSRAVELVKQGSVSRVDVEGDHVELLGKDGIRLTTLKEKEVSFLETLQGYGVTSEQLAALQMEVHPPGGSFLEVAFFGLGVLLLAALAFLVFRPGNSLALGRADSSSAFRKSTAKEQSAGAGSATFDDVAGAAEAKQELQEVVEFLRSPERFTSLGARVPHGVLLVGPPGTGKTLLARAVAGEAGVRFFSCSGSEFVEMYVGVGAARIRDLFQRAKRSTPCILFVDEIDALGRRRNSGSGNEEREQSLNQILVEMDGFDRNAGIVVLAATNRPDVLDPALLRPGRFDRRIVVDSPDVQDRLAILKVHARGKPLDPSIDLEQFSRQTTGFSGADLENVMNEAALLAARRRLSSISSAELEEAVERVQVGLARKSRVISDREKRITAYHEAGHALVAHQLPNVDPVQRISIIPRGATGGHTRLQPLEDRRLWSKSQLVETIAFALGGMAAEELTFGEMTTGSSNDLSEATQIARKMVCLFGMSAKLGPIALGGEEDGWSGLVSAETTTAADSETRRLLAEGRQTALTILAANRPRLTQLAQRLYEEEALQGEALASALESEGAVVEPETTVVSPMAAITRSS